jgi:predicted DNA-binding transcriptional regulator AlpA
MLNPLLNEKEVAKLLNLSVKTIQRYRLIGGGPEFIKINKSVRYSPQSIEEYLKPRVRSTCQ